MDELPWMDTAKSDFKSALDYFWNSWASAQEDLVLIVCGSAVSWAITHGVEIKRKDGVSNLCEMKFTNEEYSIDEDEHRKIENRLSRFQTMTETKDAIHVTLICGNGYKRSKYSEIVQNVIVGDDLFT